MRQDGTRCEKAVVSVDGRIGFVRGKHFGHKGYFGRVFRDMSLNREFGFSRQSAQGGKQGRGTGRRKSRCDDGGYQLKRRIDQFDMFNRSFRIPDCRFRRSVAVIIRVQVRVHITSTDKRALALVQTNRSKQISAVYMRSGIVSGGRRAVGERASHASSVDLLRFCLRCERGLEWKRIFLEPVQKCALAKESDVRVLRCMDMGISRQVSKENRLRLGGAIIIRIEEGGATGANTRENEQDMENQDESKRKKREINKFISISLHSKSISPPPFTSPSSLPTNRPLT